MLSILLLLAAAPQTVIPSAPPPPPAPSASMRVLGDSGFGCASEIRQAGDPTVGGSLMWRDGDARVAHYRLLDRRVNGCPAPVIVNYRVPGSDAIGREARRTPAAPVTTPRD
ncbi:hypothetical protein ACETK8_00565 [Brevundimonas staleyi]|uniref:Uncharacterized protein n=1 Tax=Brevundimonas staleyi TaxID=74326 RepID=A0ABW0FR66_9CAUL